MGPTLLHDFEAKAASDPDFPVVERGDLTWRRRDLLDLTEEMDRLLPARPAGSLVAIRARNGPTLLASLLLARRRRWTALLVDGETRDNQLTQTVELFAMDGAVDVIESCAWARRAPQAVHWIDGDSETASLHWGPEFEADPPAFVKLTSGSTGRPNAVVATDSQVRADESALLTTMELGTERVLTTIPMAHSYGFSSVAVAALRRDFTLVLPEGPNPLSAIHCLRHGAISFLPSVPAWLKALTDLPTAPARLGGTRTVISAGAPLSPAVAAAFRDRFEVPIHNFYGASECGGICYDRDGEASVAGALGRPVDGVEIELVDQSATDGDTHPMNATHDAAVGRVCVRSAAVALGRLAPHDPADAAKSRKLVVDETLGNGRFVTMDLGQMDDLGLRILGRADDLLNLRGRKVHPREIEAVLDSYPEVRESYVFQTAALGTEVLVAVIVGAEDTSRAELLEWARARLPDYKVPRAVARLASLCRNPRGKIDRRRLEDEALQALRESRNRVDP